jgi:hypothetical protein
MPNNKTKGAKISEAPIAEYKKDMSSELTLIWAHAYR